MASKKALRAVSDDERGAAEPSSLVDASEMSERALLARLRKQLCQEMDTGKVPAHALASVTSKILECDRAIRGIDARDAQEATSDASEVEDGKFDASAV